MIMALNRLSRSRAPSTDTDTGAFFQELGVPIITTDDPYREETLQRICALRPGVLVRLGGFGIVKPPLLRLIPLGVLSYHHGDMRKYRGQPPAFWELNNGEQRIGVTVQRLSPGLDCGEPIVERSFPIRQSDTVATLSHRIFSESTDMMLEAVRLLGDPSFRPETIASYGCLYTLPNLRQWLMLQARVRRRVLASRCATASGSSAPTDGK